MDGELFIPLLLGGRVKFPSALNYAGLNRVQRKACSRTFKPLDTLLFPPKSHGDKLPGNQFLCEKPEAQRGSALA